MVTKPDINQVVLRGTAQEAPCLSHENHGEPFYKFSILVPRLSGQDDILNVLVSHSLLRLQPVEAGMGLEVSGQLRSFNNRSGQGSRLLLSIFAQTLAPAREDSLNQIFLSGTICKPPVLRRTPLGRSICDLMLAVNRRYGRADYLPCIAWGQVALTAGGMAVGQRLALEGRVQSRRYNKVLADRVEERTAYEVSVMRLLETEELSPAAGESFSAGLDKWEAAQ